MRKSSLLLTLLALIAAMFLVAPSVFAGNQDDSPITVSGDKEDIVNGTDVNGQGELYIDSTVDKSTGDKTEIKDNTFIKELNIDKSVTDVDIDKSTKTTDIDTTIIKDNTLNIDKSVTDIDVNKKTEIKVGDINPDNDMVDIEKIEVKDSFNKTTEIKNDVDIDKSIKVEDSFNKKTDVDVDIKKTDIKIEDVKVNSDNTDVDVDYDYTVIMPEDNRPQAMIVVDNYEGHLQTNNAQYNPSPFDARATSVDRTWSLAELKEGAKNILKNRKIFNRDWIWKGVLPADKAGNPIEKRDKDGNLIYLQAKSLKVYILNPDGSLPANLSSNLSLDKAGTIRLLNQDPKVMAEEVFALGGFLCVNKGISNVGVLPCNTYESIDDLIAAAGGVGVSNTLNPYTLISAMLNGNAAREKTYVRVLSGWYMIPLVGEFGAGH